LGAQLEDAGVQVFHGLVGLKNTCETRTRRATRSRRENSPLCAPWHRNLQSSTARFYTDFSLFTRDDAITSAVHDVFNFLTAYAEQPHYKPLMVAPTDLAKTTIALIDRETRHAKRGRPSRIIAKFNALLDPPVIQALYRASQAGVEIDLIVRGQCALVPAFVASAAVSVCAARRRFSRTQPYFLLRKWRQSRRLSRQCGLDAQKSYARVEVLFPVKDQHLRERICNECWQAIFPIRERPACSSRQVAIPGRAPCAMATAFPFRNSCSTERKPKRFL